MCWALRCGARYHTGEVNAFLKGGDLVRKALTTLALCAALLAVPMPHAYAAEGKAQCDACEALLTAGPERLRHTDVALVCIYFTQEQPGSVVLTLFGPDGSVIRRVSKQAAVRGRFCVGKAWVVRAARVELCNRDDTRRAVGERLRALIRRGRTRPGEPVRLIPDPVS